MNTTPMNQARPPLPEAELEAQAIRELERMQRALDRKKSGYTPKRRGSYESRNR